MFLRLLIILLIVAIAGAVFYYSNTSDESSPLLRGLAEVRSLTREAAPEPPAETTVYKWKDKNGEWHFSNQPPPEGVAAEITIYRSDVNVMPSPKADTSPEEKAANNPGDIPLLPITDPARVKQLIDDAKNVQNLADERQQQIDQPTNNQP